MNFTQMHHHLRLELDRRIQRGTVSVSLLLRQTGIGQSHLCNFIHGRRQLSLEAIDRVLLAQHLTAADLLPALSLVGTKWDDEEGCAVPVVSHSTALFEPVIRASAVQSILRLPAGVLATFRTLVSNPRRTWQRFVAVRVSDTDALAMEPLLFREAIILIDRHYIALAAYRAHRPNVYAFRHGARLAVRYVDCSANTLVLRPHNLAFPLHMIEIDPGEPLCNTLAGRIAIILNQT